jgi:ketosteroid isomerase-like protein
MPTYLAAYANDYKGQAPDRASWERERRDRIAARKQIQVAISDLGISVNGNTAIARFRQQYSSEVLSTTSRKTLTLGRTPEGKWLIQQEVSGN